MSGRKKMAGKKDMKRQVGRRKGGGRVSKNDTTSPSPCIKKMKTASVTVEAALVLPLFIFFSMQLLSIFEMMSIYCRMECALQETAAEVAACSYALKDTSGSRINSLLLSETFVREEVVRKAGAERINASLISGGIAGLHLYRSDIAENESDIELILTYRVKPWFSIRGIGSMNLVHHSRVKAWVGYEKESETGEESRETVYVTKTGEAYHLYADCAYLKADSRCVTGDMVSALRNNDGEKYYPCEFCAKDEVLEGDDFYYISGWGNRFHVNPLCRALEKASIPIPLDEVGNRHLCSKCAGRAGKKTE